LQIILPFPFHQVITRRPLREVPYTRSFLESDRCATLTSWFGPSLFWILGLGISFLVVFLFFLSLGIHGIIVC
jgi:hypothetical protein